MEVATAQKEIEAKTTISKWDFVFEEETFSGELDFPALGEYSLPQSEINVLAMSPARQKFKYPTRDPPISELKDERTDSEKLEDILRVSSQILTKEELVIWNEIAGQNLSEVMRFQSDVRIPKSVLDAELRKHAKLHQDGGDQTQTLTEFETIGIPSRIDSAQVSIRPKKTINLMPINNAALSDSSINELLDICKYKLVSYLKTFDHVPRRYSVFRTCPNLLANFVKVLMHRNLTDKKSIRILKMYKRLVKKHQSPNKKLLKNLLSIFFRHNLLNEKMFDRKEVTLFVDFANKGPSVNVTHEGKTIPWLFDTGSSETLIPHTVWESMGINDSKLNCSTIYHINSVSHSNTDAVKGSISLELTFPTMTGDTITLRHTCLILRPRLALATPLLGTDFMSKYDVEIKFQHNIPRVTILDDEVPILEKYGSSMAMFVKPKPKPVLAQPEVPGPTHIWNNFSDIAAEDFAKLYEPYQESELDHGVIGVNEFLERNKQAKTDYHKQIDAFSVQPESYDDILNKEAAQRSIIPDVGCSDPQTRLTHLAPEDQIKMKALIESYADIFSRHKHHLGTFTGWKIGVEVDPSINCRQAPRNRVLPMSCKQDLLKYKQAGLFNDSTGLADKYCANITLVLRNQVKEVKKSTKADKYVQKKSPTKVTVNETRPLAPEMEQSEPSRSLYRMTIDFRDLNRATKNERTCQLPSIQSIEHCFHDCFVTTLDLSNCYPSILLEESSQNYFNFYMENEILNHARLPQGWCAALPYCQKAVAWTFRDSVLARFIVHKQLTSKTFPYDSFVKFLKGFVDDLAIYSTRKGENARAIHMLCIEAVFFAVREGGWLVKLEVSTFMNDEFVFLGLFWNLKESASTVQNDRVKAILQHRVPRSMPELASRLATISYFSSFIPLLKRIAMPLYYVVRTGIFKWTQVHLEAYNNLLYLMALQVRNYIFNPDLPLMMMSDMAALEVSSAIFQWCPDTLSLKLLQTKSILLTAALRKQSPVHKEAYGTDLTLKEGKPYLFQTRSKVNYLFSDASSISYIARTKPFSSFLQQLSEEVSRYPSLTAIHMPGRAMWFCDLLSRQLDNVIVTRPDTDISKEQSSIIPALRNVKPGAVLTNDELLKVFQTKVGPELFDVSTSDYEYIQKIDFNLYVNPNQFFTSEREFILGGLLSRLDPELALQLPTLKDIFKIKESGSRFDTKVKRLNFINQISEQLKDLPYDNNHLEEIKDFLKEKIQEYGLKPNKRVQAGAVTFKREHTCVCPECTAIVEHPSNSLVSSTRILKTLRPSIDLLGDLNIEKELDAFDTAKCTYAQNTLASVCLDAILSFVTNRDTFQLDDKDLLVFNYHFDHQEALDIRFNDSDVEIVLRKDITMKPSEIIKFPVNFLTDLKAIPELIEPDIDHSIALAPLISFQPLLRMSQLNIANCSEYDHFLPKDTVLLKARFQQSQILGISVPLEKLLNKDMLKGDVIGHYFLKNSANAIAKVALRTCARDIVSHWTEVGKREKQVLQQQKDNPDIDTSNPATIFELDAPSTDLIFQAVHLMNKLLKEKFTCSKEDIAVLQRSDLVLRQIYDKCKAGKASKFRIIDKILYKLGAQENIFILCVPTLLAEQIVYESHTTLSFHFSIQQLTALLHPLVYHPNLAAIIEHMVKTCLVCQMSPPKMIRRLVGEERTQYFRPLECLVIDSLYLPSSKHGFKYGLVCVDAATSKAIVFPSVNLKAATVKRHLRTLFGINKPPLYLIADYGPEMRENLDGFLAEFNVTMLGTKPYSKGSTAQAEVTIRLVKQALRQLVLAHVHEWPEVLPHMLAGLNSAPLRDTGISRDELFYTPLSVHNLHQLSGLFTPEALFNDHAEQHAKVVLRRKQALKNRAKMDKIEYKVGTLVSAENVPTTHTTGDSQELKPVIHGFFRVTEVLPTSLRLISLTNGETRTLPREYCRRANLTDLSIMKLKLKEHQFKIIARNLFRANKYLTPDKAKIWEEIIGFKFPELPLHIDENDDDSEPAYDLFIDDVEAGALDDQSPNTAPDPVIGNSGDEFANNGQNADGLEIIPPPNEQKRRTRSGRAYNLSINTVRPILVSRTSDLDTESVQSLQRSHDPQSCDSARALPAPELQSTHPCISDTELQDRKRTRRIRWRETYEERTYLPGSKFDKFFNRKMQPFLANLEPKVKDIYFMCCFEQEHMIDLSPKELFYATSRVPNWRACLKINDSD